MSLRIRFLTATDDPQEMAKITENVHKIEHVEQVFQEFADSSDPVLKRVFNAVLKKGLTPHEGVDKASEIGNVEGVTHSYLIGARYLL